MSEAELFELLAINTANCMQSFTVYLTLIFGYLTASNFIATKLSRPHAHLLTAVYIFAVLSTIMTLLNGLSIIDYLISSSDEATVLFDGLLFSDTKLWLYGMGTVCLSGVIASVYFFYNARAKNA